MLQNTLMSIFLNKVTGKEDANSFRFFLKGKTKHRRAALLVAVTRSTFTDWRASCKGLALSTRAAKIMQPIQF